VKYVRVVKERPICMVSVHPKMTFSPLTLNLRIILPKRVYKLRLVEMLTFPCSKCWLHFGSPFSNYYHRSAERCECHTYANQHWGGVGEAGQEGCGGFGALKTEHQNSTYRHGGQLIGHPASVLQTIGTDQWVRGWQLWR